MNIDETLAYIHTTDWRGTKPGLTRIRALLDRLGNPERQLKFVHVTGTNGKGSTCAMLASILHEAGLRTGLYTSPYIVRFNERIQVDGEQIPDDALCALTEEVRAQADAMEFWLTQHDVDGFRCDMAMLVPIEFWNETSLRLRRVKPDLFMLAEAEERNLFEEGAFDACYAWRMHHLMNDVARQRTRVTALRDYIYADRDDYPDSAMRLAFTSKHDENSWHGSEFSRLGDAREIMAVFTFVVPRGLPLIYTGQEIGYDHSFAFFDRDPIPRYEANAFTGFYRRLTALRHDNPALAAGERGGAMTEIRNNAEDCLMTLVRETADNRVVAVMNLSPYAIHADYYTGIYAGMYTDAMTGEPFELRGRVEEDMAPWSYRILTR